MMTITIQRSIATSVRPSQRVFETAAMFGLGVDQSRELMIVPRCDIPLPHLAGKRGIVFVTGPSGSGKSTILKLIAEQIRVAQGDSIAMFQFDQLPPLPEVPLVDALDGPGMTLLRTLSILSMTGLGDAFVMLRTPGELSDGQRYRLRLAQVIAESMRSGEGEDGIANPIVILADEFGATLDRLTAQTVSRNLRRWVSKAGSPLSLIAATTHDDLLEALQPEVLVWKGLGDRIDVVSQ